jgi:hypothetical protein
LPTDAATWEASGAEVFLASLQQRPLPPWLRDALADADAVERGLGARFLDVPSIDSRDAYQDMEDFIDTVEGTAIQSHLWDAIRGRGAFRRFTAELGRHPSEEQRWYTFKQARLRDRVLAWLESEGIEPIEDPDR